MRVPLSWLCDFAPFLDGLGRLGAESDPARVLADTFDDLGMVVEGIEVVGEGLGGVVAARVIDIAAIPKADRIRRVMVDAGDPEPVQVVCGAWNFAVGDIVPLARVGAVLPGDFEIAERKMKGVASYGMLCSGRELGLSQDGAGIMILDGSPPVGVPLAKVLGVEADVVFDLAIEANRPDAMCMAGVARDAAARLGLPFAIPERLPAPGGEVAVTRATPAPGGEVAVTRATPAPGGEVAVTPNVEELASLVVESVDLCPDMLVRVLTGVEVGPSPHWLARRLTLAGMRPINSVVDASNYVMLELGQPTHPYDLDQLAGRGLVVRQAGPGEVVATLDGVERRLGEGGGGVAPVQDCVIGDAEGGLVGIAGIMGGSSSEISDDTTRVLLEVAYFTPMAIARTSRRLGLRTEASVRFERGTDPEGLERAADRFCQLVGSIASAGVAPGTLRGGRGAPPRRQVVVRTARVNAMLGSDLDDAAVASYLGPIGFEVERLTPGQSSVTVPGFRPDTTREIDVIEEVARHHGYSKLARRVPSPPQVGGLTRYQADRRRVGWVLTGLGANEAWTPTLLGPGDHDRAGMPGNEVRLANPMVQAESILRRALLPGLLRAIAFNQDRRNGQVRFFEIGQVFQAPAPGEDRPREGESLAVALAWPSDDAATAVTAWRRLAGAMHLGHVDLVGDAWPGLHPGRSARLVLGGQTVGGVGEVDPDVAEAFGLAGRRIGYFECDLTGVLARSPEVAQARPVSAFPSADIDLAFEVDVSIAAGVIEDTLIRAGGDLLVDLELFDVYRGPPVPDGHRSLAWRLRLCSLERTLTEADVAGTRQALIEAVESTHGAHLRG
ncbi:MAG: phenylalanine--tRNA ligase subunit beta [Acidimicrobiales bacterium]